MLFDKFEAMIRKFPFAQTNYPTLRKLLCCLGFCPVVLLLTTLQMIDLSISIIKEVIVLTLQIIKEMIKFLTRKNPNV